MGCNLSKKDEAQNDVVSLCGNRKRLAKAAVVRRKAFAEAHCKYITSLSSVSSAIGVFVGHLSSSSSDSPFTEIGPPTIQNQNSVQTCSDSSSVESGSSEEEEENGEVCEHFYGDDHPLMPSNGSEIGCYGSEIGWDFFNLLDNPPPPPPPMAVLRKKGDRKLGMKKRESGKLGDEVKGVKVSGKELVVALKDLEMQFARAYESGLVVSKMLEVNKPHLQPLMEEIKENSTKIFQPNVWNRSPSSQSSSSKSLISSSSISSSTWTDSRADLFDGAGGMESGSHSFTLGRLYAWEKKLYDEVKAAEQTRKAYQQKCSQLKQPSVMKDNFSPSKETAEISYLYNRILVARRSVDSISKRIEKLRDEELQPQLIELLHGLTRTWKIMSESHETQNKIISGVKSFNTPANGQLCNYSHRLATLQLEKELRNWQSSFLDYLSTQKAYVMCLCGWLSKLVDPGPEAYRFKGPTLLITCRNWMASLEKLPVKEVKFSMKSLAKHVHDMWVQQGEEHEAKKRVDGLVKEMDRKTLALKREEGGRVLILLKPTVQKFRRKARNSAEDFAGRTNMVDLLRMRLESEKVKHQSCIDRTQAATLDGLKTGFSSVFESLTDFSRASVSLYADLVAYYEHSDGAN